MAAKKRQQQSGLLLTPPLLPSLEITAATLVYLESPSDSSSQKLTGALLNDAAFKILALQLEEIALNWRRRAREGDDLFALWFGLFIDLGFSSLFGLSSLS